METKVKEATKHFQRTNAEMLRIYMHKYNLGNKEMGVLLGVTGGGISGWLIKNSMPKYVDLAIECLERRSGTSGQNEAKAFLVAMPERSVATFKALSVGILGMVVTELKLK